MKAKPNPSSVLQPPPADVFGATVADAMKSASGLSVPMDALTRIQGDYLKHAKIGRASCRERVYSSV